jgi:uncharacterized membrane protein YjjP (DUF1212 family)
VSQELKGGQVISAGSATSVSQASVDATLDVLLDATELLLQSGQTTQRSVEAVHRLGAAFHYRTDVFPRWGQITVRLWNGCVPCDAISTVTPTDVDMGKVSATMEMIYGLAARNPEAGAVRATLQGIYHSRPVATPRFLIMTGAGAAALGVIFGVSDLLSLTLIALSALMGAALRQWLLRFSSNPFLPPFAASLTAGIIGAVVVDLDLSSAQQLIAVCPCLVLVPGPHLLNGALDLARAEISLGVARLAYAGMIILMLCAGLLLGLAVGGVALPASGVNFAVPFSYDALAAAVAVVAYGTFYSLPWRMVPIPVLIGVLAHAARWVIVTAVGLRVEMGAFIACLVVSVMLTPIAERWHLPFAGIAFASIVSLGPGVFLFRAGGGLVTLISLGAKAPTGLLQDVIVDGATAFLIVLAMALGLIIPKLCIDRFRHANVV